MEKEKASRKKSSERYTPLPVPPPDPTSPRADLPEAFRRIIGYEEREAAFLRTLQATIDEEERQAANRMDDGSEGAVGGEMDHREGSLAEECDTYIRPLLARSGPSISAALVTEGAIDQLDKLHGILENLLHMQEQSYRLRRCTRDVDTLTGLKTMQTQISRDPEAFLSAHPESLDAENELEMEYNEMLLLAAGNSASSKRNSSKKQRMRSKSVANPPDEHGLQLTPDRDKQYPLRRQSAITDIKAKVSKWTKVKAAFKWERANPSLNENGKSTDSGIGLSPINVEVARYLRVPSSPLGGGGGGAGSSADSVLSYSSGGHLLSGGSSNPATPGTMSSASSIDDVRPLSDDFRLAPIDDSIILESSSSRCVALSGVGCAAAAADQEDTRRTRSLDGETTQCTNFLQQYDKNYANQTPWRKVKDIIKTHGGSLRLKTRHRASVATMGDGCINGRNSPVANFIPVSTTSTIIKTPNTQSAITSTISTSTSINPTTSVSCPSPSIAMPMRKTYPLLMLTAPPFCDPTAIAHAHGGQLPVTNADLPNAPTSAKSAGPSSGRGSTRRPKALHDIGCLPEGQPLDMSTVTHKRGAPGSAGRPPPSPLNMLASRQSSHPDSSDTDQLEQRCSPLTIPRQHFNWTTSLTRSRKSVGSLSGRNVSAPSSPSQKFEFFGEFESEDLSSGDFSEPCTPHTKLSPKTSLTPQDEINRKYHELQQQISLEFQAKQKEWERIRHSSIGGGYGGGSSSSGVGAQVLPQRDDQSNNNRDFKQSTTPSKPVEENLTADFKKKLQEWRIKQSQSTSAVKDVTTASSPTKDGDKKIDWHLWKTGQLKLEGQGLKQMPDEKDLPEEFQRKLDEWKRIKATGSASNTDGSTAKRQSLKSNQLLKCDLSSSKKLKSSADDLVVKPIGEREKLFRLKSLAEPKPAKEVVVQTTKGAIKFEGISRKFTQKLYEWEKARGIGPEASTFALLHPGYRPLVVGNGEVEASLPPNAQPTPMGRSLSMDSISPHASVPSIISHQHSSLSLNNVDDLIDTKTAKKGCGFGSSNSDLDLDGDDDEEDDELLADEEEPEAVIVEVEDDYVETAASLFTASPMIEKQTPIYRYEQTRKEYYAGKKEAVFQGESKPTIAVAASQALKNATKMVASLQEVRHGFKENILHVQTVLRSLVETLPTLKTNLQENSERLRESVDVVQNMAINIIEKLTDLEETVSSKEDLDARMTLIDGQLSILRKALNFVCKHTASRKTSRNEDLPAITFTSDSPIPPERNIAVVSLAPIVFQGQVIINQVQVHEDRNGLLDSEHAPATQFPISDCDSGNRNTTTDTTFSSAPAQVSENEVSKKLTRNLSNGAKRKTKLRRMGSRQNSKTESDSDDDPQNVVLDTPRRVKRKTSKAKLLVKSNSLDKADEQPSSVLTAGDDVVYTLKLKAGKMIEQHEVSLDFCTQPEPDPLEILENLSLENSPTAANVFVKTKRRIFSPAQNFAGAVVSKEIESSSASDRRDSEPKTPELKLVTNLPPLPQSPSQQRRSDSRTSSKEPSPAIRLMIAKYNQRLSVERRNSSPLNSSGSCSPVAWRSPVLERRVRAESDNQSQVFKSSSAGNVGREVKLSEATTILDTDAAISKLVKGVLKSSSAGILSENWLPPDDEDVDCGVSLACDSLKKISLSRSECRQCIGVEDKPEGMYRKNSAKFSLPKKISAKQNRDAESASPDKYTNTLPKITRKYDAAKPPSPRSGRKPAKVFLELNIRNANLAGTVSDNGPDTPLSDRAIKLKRAKEDFLKMSAGYRSICPPGEDIWQNRISQISAGSETSADEQRIIKSASVGMINESGKHSARKSSDKGSRKPSTGFGGFVSLPRNTTRTSKSQGSMAEPVTVSPSNSSSKFGFSSIANKLKLVKLRRNSKEIVNTAKMNTVTKLCRQSLMVDLPPGGAVAGPSGSSSQPSTCDVQKSGSAHSMGLGSLLFRRMERAEKLKKSKSIGHLNNNGEGG